MAQTTTLVAWASVSGRIWCVMAAAVLLISCGTASRSKDPVELEQLQLQQDRQQQEAEQLYARGSEALAKGKLDEARTFFERATELNPFHGAAYNDLGAIYYRSGNLHQAALAFDAARRNLPNKYEPLYNLGMVWEAAGRLKDAVEAYSDALKLAPDEVATMENLARVYIRMGTNEREAIRLLEDALLRETRPDWQHWIRMELLTVKRAVALPPPSSTTTRPASTTRPVP